MPSASNANKNVDELEFSFTTFWNDIRNYKWGKGVQKGQLEGI